MPEDVITNTQGAAAKTVEQLTAENADLRKKNEDFSHIINRKDKQVQEGQQAVEYLQQLNEAMTSFNNNMTLENWSKLSGIPVTTLREKLGGEFKTMPKTQEFETEDMNPTQTKFFTAMTEKMSAMEQRLAKQAEAQERREKTETDKQRQQEINQLQGMLLGETKKQFKDLPDDIQADIVEVVYPAIIIQSGQFKDPAKAVEYVHTKLSRFISHIKGEQVKKTKAAGESTTVGENVGQPGATAATPEKPKSYAEAKANLAQLREKILLQRQQAGVV